MTGGEHQVFKTVAFINEQLVDAHLLEIRHVVFLFFELVVDARHFYRQVGFAFFQTFQGCFGYFVILPAHYFQVQFNIR